MDEPRRRQAARERISVGELPSVSPTRIWIHDATWEVCAVCREEITESTSEYELQFDLLFGLGRTELVSFWFHPLCLAAWLVERGAE